jgi:hypothetical protein
VVGVVALVVTVLLLPESPPEPSPARPAPEQAPSPEALQAERDDPQRLRESSRVRRMVPVYPGSTFTPMGLLEANGNMMEMGFFEAKAPIDEVVDYYMREFGKRGYRVVQQPSDNGGATVNYYDATLGMLVAITATPKETGREPRTVVFPSVTAAPDGILLKAQVPDDLPKPEDLVTVMRVDDHSSGPAKGSTTMTQVARGSPAQLSAFYRKEMGTRGYTVVGSSSSTRVEVLDFERPGQRVSITISPLSGDNHPESVISTVVENHPNRKGT